MRIPVTETGVVTPVTATDAAGRPLAAWQTKRPWLWATLVAVGGVLLSAFGVGFSQVRHLDLVSATYAQAAFVGLSALLGFAVMWRTRSSLAEYGFRKPLHLDRALWLVPLLAVPVILVVFSKVALTPALAAAYVVLAVCVGFSEEIWFRGLLLATLRKLGSRTAIVGGSVVFGALHLTNLFAGRQLLYVGLQIMFACVVGFVLAEIVAVTGSLWIAIAWHAVYDLVSFSTGDELTPAALVIVAVTAVVLAAYAVWLWPKVPALAPSPAVTGWS